MSEYQYYEFHAVDPAAHRRADDTTALPIESRDDHPNTGLVTASFVVKSVGYMHWHVCSKNKVSNCSPRSCKQRDASPAAHPSVRR